MRGQRVAPWMGEVRFVIMMLKKVDLGSGLGGTGRQI